MGKFSQILKIRKQELDNIESRLALARIKLENFACELDENLSLISAYKFPKNGNLAEINLALEEQKILRNQRADLNEKISLTKTEISHLNHKYKNAMIEFEKIKHLQDVENAEFAKKLKRSEQILIDELAVMRFNMKEKI